MPSVGSLCHRVDVENYHSHSWEGPSLPPIAPHPDPVQTTPRPRDRDSTTSTRVSCRAQARRMQVSCCRCLRTTASGRMRRCEDQGFSSVSVLQTADPKVEAPHRNTIPLANKTKACRRRQSDLRHSRGRICTSTSPALVRETRAARWVPLGVSTSGPQRTLETGRNQQKSIERGARKLRTTHQ